AGNPPKDDSRAHARRRGLALVDAILEAVWDEVHAIGYANLTMEAVAARAKTSKAVIYRRWPSRAALVHAAVRHRVRSISEEDCPDTGSLRGDVLVLLHLVVQRFDEFGSDVVHGLIAEHEDLPPEVFQVVPHVMQTILQRAASRGEVRLDKVTPRIAALPMDLTRHAMLFSQIPVTEATLAEIADDIFLPLVRA
ncbi:MAG TPA: TetR/AcrR family transcriptional regulator, partial [Ktedonobacterales bacterium]|nr:TetR/AcrR family transcriptional regulator [Ktedonobacterales bacterium]